ncbi:DUF1206 domain-containing protein [Actinomadura sp. ATCC 31491]|uniref:DUF1206 domain-containing protein n=1 Tax=Actinomadura luzonensis TaxID=2805427 RepID=A0ABT0G4K1_9ACTN|nr:DUF1206 domain-containing protein [Actinomadura luzonensis]MCK2219058.1 DUF1206 domain-containing protein [Actinomadura luzonensis]
MSTAGREVRGAARRAARSPVMDVATRIGLACRGVLYALVGAVAVQVGLGERSKEADKAGAIETVAELPFGAGLLWIMTLGFVALALWQTSEALFGHGEAIERVEAVARVAVYALVVATLLSVLTKGKASSDDEKSRDLTAKLLDLPGGQVIVGAVGLGLVVLGVYWVRQGLTKGFRKELDQGSMPAPTRAVMDRLGVGGFVARGAVAALAGILVGQAAITFDPDKAGGIDTALREFADTPAGPLLLVVVALGLLLFAAYCFGEARWRRT